MLIAGLGGSGNHQRRSLHKMGCTRRTVEYLSILQTLLAAVHAPGFTYTHKGEAGLAC